MLTLGCAWSLSMAVEPWYELTVCPSWASWLPRLAMLTTRGVCTSDEYPLQRKYKNEATTET